MLRVWEGRESRVASRPACAVRSYIMYHNSEDTDMLCHLYIEAGAEHHIADKSLEISKALHVRCPAALGWLQYLI
jgi:hypothetical protein